MAREHEKLLKAFAHPPNVFDEFVRAREHEARMRAQELEASLIARSEQLLLARERAEATEGQATALKERTEALQIRTERAEQEAARAWERAARAEDEVMQSRSDIRVLERQAEHFERQLKQQQALLEEVYRSRSWRLMAPYRKLGEIIHRTARPRQSAPRLLMPRPERPTLFMECTHTFHSDVNTGIQRVVRNVVRHAPAAAARYGFDVVPVIMENDRFVPADVDRVLADKLRPVASPKDEAAGNVGQAKSGARRFWRLLLGMLSAAVPSAAVRRFLYQSPDRFGLAWCVLLPLRLVGLRPWPQSLSEISAPYSLDHFQSLEESVLLLLDSSWHVPIWGAVARFKQRGGKVIGVIYDLIPITHPQACVPALAASFEAWFREYARRSEASIAISRATANEVRRFLDLLTVSSADHSIDHFYLGSELDLVQFDDQPRGDISRIFGGDRHVFLMVGSIEPRKNHSYVLDAFEQHWARGGESVVVMIGRQAWKTEDFLERVTRHEDRDRRLFVLRDASDAELDYAYRNASALIIASEIEGFGLPVVEAFQRGLPVLCSDIPVFREIADGKARFFELERSDSLADAIGQFCRTHDVTRRSGRAPQSWISWRESTDQLCAALVRVLALAAPLPDALDRVGPESSPEQAVSSRAGEMYVSGRCLTS